MGLASVGVLIYFIHHLARSIQIDAITSTVEREPRWVIEDVYLGQPGYLEPEERCPDPPAWAVVLPAGRSGYLQAVQLEPLVQAAADHDLVVRLARQVGDHVVEGTPLAWAWPRVPDQSPPDPRLLRAALEDAVALGFERTMVQDVPFGLRRLVDIGNKALSPAINDPTRASRRSIICRCCCACWPVGGSATGSTMTSRGRCGWPSSFRSSPTICGWARPRSGGRGPRSRP